MAPTSRTRQMAATQAALVAAGRTVFARHGYHGASLDRVAAEAGFTKGAVYASFKTKADLLLAIYAERALERAEAMAAVAARVDTLEELRVRLLDDWSKGLEHERGWALVRLEFWAHAARDPQLRARLRAAHVPVREAIAAALESVAQRSGEPLAAAPLEFATLVMAIGNGLNLEALLDEPGTDRLYDEATRKLGFVPEEADG